MVNTWRKGLRVQGMFRNRMQAEGYSMLFESHSNQWHTVDFACFDLVAVKGKDWWFVSCKGDSAGSNYLPHKDEIRRWVDDHGMPEARHSLAIWRERRWEGRGDKKAWVESHWEVEDFPAVQTNTS